MLSHDDKARRSKGDGGLDEHSLIPHSGEESDENHGNLYALLTAHKETVCISAVSRLLRSRSRLYLGCISAADGA